jgi:hypothetical protein
VGNNLTIGPGAEKRRVCSGLLGKKRREVVFLYLGRR